jgi:hypothetical protein
MLSNESRHPCNLVVGDSENPKMQNTKRISFEAQYICRLRRLGVLGMVIILFAFPPPSASVIAFQPVGRSRGHKRIFEKSISKARYITILKSQDDSRKQDTATSSVDNLKTLLLPSSSCNPDQMSGTELGKSYFYFYSQKLISLTNSNNIYITTISFSLHWRCCI